MIPGVVPIGVMVIGPPVRFEITPAGGGNTSSRAITAINIPRDTNDIVLYRAPQTASMANEWGIELRVVAGVVDYKRMQGDTVATPVSPSTSVVLSGYNQGANFLNNYGVGATVRLFDAANNEVPTA